MSDDRQAPPSPRPRMNRTEVGELFKRIHKAHVEGGGVEGMVRRAAEQTRKIYKSLTADGKLKDLKMFRDDKG